MGAHCQAIEGQGGTENHGMLSGRRSRPASPKNGLQTIPTSPGRAEGQRNGLYIPAEGVWSTEKVTATWLEPRRKVGSFLLGTRCAPCSRRKRYSPWRDRGA